MMTTWFLVWCLDYNDNNMILVWCLDHNDDNMIFSLVFWNDYLFFTAPAS